eukprot:1637301-Pleurochrysis_carterae.AAC.4
MRDCARRARRTSWHARATSRARASAEARTRRGARPRASRAAWNARGTRRRAGAPSRQAGAWAAASADGGTSQRKTSPRTQACEGRRKRSAVRKSRIWNERRTMSAGGEGEGASAVRRPAA